VYHSSASEQAAFCGQFSALLAPDQVRVITLNDEALINYAKPMVAELRANMVRVDTDFSATPFKAKIANAEQLRVHTMLVRRSRHGSRRSQRPPSPRRPARREAEGGSRGEYRRA
jgi:threonyl-tRNA synthetase